VRVGFFFREALRALKRNGAPSFAAMATVVVTVLVLGVFIPVVQATTGAANEVRGKVIADVYLKPGVTKPDVDRVRRLIESTPAVGKVVFVSKEQAYREERKRKPGGLRPPGLESPARHLPRDAHAPGRHHGRAQRPSRPCRRRVSGPVADPAMDEVRNREEDTNKILSATRVVKLTIAGLAVLLVIASVLLIANTIRSRSTPGGATSR
jgi:cell division transport system permease protein